MSDPVQFFGKDQVMKEAEDRECSAWAIFIRRDLYRKYEGSDLHESLETLSDALDTLSMNQSEALHKIKFYELDGKDKIKITERTVCDAGSFTFKLVDPAQREAKQLGYINSQANIIAEKKIWNLEQQVKDQQKLLEVNDEPQTIGDIARSYLQRPDELQQIINIGRALLGMPVVAFPNSIGNITRAGEETPEDSALTTEQSKNLDRLSNAVDTLERKDPKLIDHLEKLAAMPDDQLQGLLAVLDLQK